MFAHFVDLIDKLEELKKWKESITYDKEAKHPTTKRDDPSLWGQNIGVTHKVVLAERVPPMAKKKHIASDGTLYKVSDIMVKNHVTSEQLVSRAFLCDDPETLTWVYSLKLPIITPPQLGVVATAVICNAMSILKTLCVMSLSKCVSEENGPFSSSPLQVALMLGRQEMCEIISNQFPQMCGRLDVMGLNIIHYAALSNDANVYRWACEMGAKKASLERYAPVSPTMAAIAWHSVNVLSHPSTMDYLFGSDNGFSALHYAAATGNMRVLEELKSYRPMYHGAQGVSPQMVAAYFGKVEALRMFKNHMTVDAFNAPDEQCRTPLHYAIHGVQIPATEVILSYNSLATNKALLQVIEACINTNPSDFTFIWALCYKQPSCDNLLLAMTEFANWVCGPNQSEYKEFLAKRRDDFEQLDELIHTRNSLETQQNTARRKMEKMIRDDPQGARSALLFEIAEAEAQLQRLRPVTDGEYLVASEKVLPAKCNKDFRVHLLRQWVANSPPLRATLPRFSKK